MKKLLSLIALTVTAWAAPAPAQAQAGITCTYRAVLDGGNVARVLVRFKKDAYGRPTSGSIQVLHDSGFVQRIQIPGRDIAQLYFAPGIDTELTANIHVRSYDVDLVVNYSGNEFAHDVRDWLATGAFNAGDLMEAYAEMIEAGRIQHRTFGFTQPMAQLTGSVRWNGELRKFASTRFVCTTEI